MVCILHGVMFLQVSPRLHSWAILLAKNLPEGIGSSPKLRAGVTFFFLVKFKMLMKQEINQIMI